MCLSQFPNHQEHLPYGLRHYLIKGTSSRICCYFLHFGTQCAFSLLELLNQITQLTWNRNISLFFLFNFKKKTLLLTSPSKHLRIWSNDHFKQAIHSFRQTDILDVLLLLRALNSSVYRELSSSFLTYSLTVKSPKFLWL